MVKVFLFKEQVYSIDEDLLPSFRKLCEQVGYRTQYNRSNFSLYLKPWLDGKRITIQLKKENKREIISRLENLLIPYGADLESTNDTKGDLYFYLQSSNQEQLEILYSSSHNEGGKELANSIYTSFLEHYPMKVAKPISLWNPFSHDKQKKLLAKIHCPAVIVNLPHSISIEAITQGILQGILNYYKVPILLPQNNSPKIWEQIILQVLEIKKQEIFDQKETEPTPVLQPTIPPQLAPVHEPSFKLEPDPEPYFKSESTPEVEPIPVEQLPPLKESVPAAMTQLSKSPTEIIQDRIKELKRIARPNPHLESISVEQLPPLQKSESAAITQLSKSPQEKIQDRIKELQSLARPNPSAINNQALLTEQARTNQAKMNQARINQDPWDSLKSHPNWNQSPFMRKHTNNANGPIIDPFKQKKSKNKNQSFTTVNPFSKGKR